jgi:hypothetical protein
MKTWTVHLRPGTAPVLVPEAFSWGAALFGPLWLFAYGAWIGAGFALAADLAVAVAASGARQIVLAVCLFWLSGLFGQDLRRWSLARRGFVLSHVVAGDSNDAAVARLLDQRPELLREAVA